MHIDVVRHDALEDRRRCGVGLRPILRLLHGELVLALVRELATSVRESRLRRSPEAEIHVSPMSIAWLRIHAGEYDKHRAEF
jgi:hypothetical protein